MLRKPLLTTHEVAELLKIKEATVRRWIRDGDMPAVNLGRDWRVAVIQLEEFLKQRVTVVPSINGDARNGANGLTSSQKGAQVRSNVGKPKQRGGPGRLRTGIKT
jgi:excisionase family DNA binding protein